MQIRKVITLVVAGLAVLTPVKRASAQMTPQPSPPVAQERAAPLAPSSSPVEPAAPAPAPETPLANPGFVEELGKLWRNSASGISSSLKSSQEAITDFNNRTKDATSDLTTKLSPQTMVNGRVMCPLAANGAPDCKAASEQLCKAKGYKDGKSADVESAEKCSAKVYLTGRTGAPGECKVENFVTRAMCQ